MPSTKEVKCLLLSRHGFSVVELELVWMGGSSCTALCRYVKIFFWLKIWIIFIIILKEHLYKINSAYNCVFDSQIFGALRKSTYIELILCIIVSLIGEFLVYFGLYSRTAQNTPIKHTILHRIIFFSSILFD